MPMSPCAKFLRLNVFLLVYRLVIDKKKNQFARLMVLK